MRKANCTPLFQFFLLLFSAYFFSIPNGFAQPTKTAKIATVSYTCRITYLPSQSLWARELALGYSNNKLLELRIDGVKVHGFALDQGVVQTHLDNERIQFEPKTGGWTSQFRDQASGQGVCIKNR